jgi:hypothetical protein
MLEQFLIETYLINLCLVRRDSTDAALKLLPSIITVTLLKLHFINVDF